MLIIIASVLMLIVESLNNCFRCSKKFDVIHWAASLSDNISGALNILINTEADIHHPGNLDAEEEYEVTL